jgi:hypothetical protein
VSPIGPSARRRHEILGRHDEIDQAVAVGLFGRHAPAQEQHLQCDIVGNAPRQALNGAGIGDDAERHFRQGEFHVLGRNDEVGGQGDLEAAADGEAVQGGDDRLVEVPHLGEPGKAARHLGLAFPPVVELLLAAVERLQVPAGREDPLAGAGQDRHPELGIVAQQGEGLAQPAAHRVVDGVHLGPIQRDLQDGPAPLDFDPITHDI